MNLCFGMFVLKSSLIILLVLSRECGTEPRGLFCRKPPVGWFIWGSFQFHFFTYRTSRTSRVCTLGGSGLPSEDHPLKLYTSWFCPFAQRAWIALEEKGMDYLQLDRTSGEREGPKIRESLAFSFYLGVGGRGGGVGGGGGSGGGAGLGGGGGGGVRLVFVLEPLQKSSTYRPGC